MKIQWNWRHLSLHQNDGTLDARCNWFLDMEWNPTQVHFIVLIQAKTSTDQSLDSNIVNKKLGTGSFRIGLSAQD